MRRRCEYPRNVGYALYGARGIRVCERWLDFTNFLADLGPKPSPRHTLDRIDSTGNYEPGNCRWATTAEQARNRRVVRMITLGNETLCLADWAAKLGWSRRGLGGRLKRLPIEQALVARAAVEKLDRGTAGRDD